MQNFTQLNSTRSVTKPDVLFNKIRLVTYSAANNAIQNITYSIQRTSVIVVILFSVWLLSGAEAQAQNNVGIGTTTPNSKAILELKATDKGFIAPRLTTVQMLAIAPTATESALLIYNTDSSCYHFYNGTAWKNLCNKQSLDSAAINKLIKNYLNSNATTIINILKGDTSLFNYTNINNAVINILKVDTSITNVAIINNANINLLKVDTSTTNVAIINNANINLLKVDTSTTNVATINNANINLLKVDTSITNVAIINNANINLLKVDTSTTNVAIINNAVIDSAQVNYITANNGNFSTLNVGGQNILQTITDSIAMQAWLTKGNIATNNYKLGTLNARDLHIYAGGLERMSIMQGTGNVGIGQTLAAEKLDIIGNQKTTGSIEFGKELKPAGLSGTTGDVLISQGLGLAPKWVLPSALGATGPAGTSGANGKNSLIKTTLEPSGVNCPSGGFKVESGVDTDNSTVLDMGEVTATSYVCDGGQGTAGPTGPIGANGIAGPTGVAGTNGANGATGLTGTAGATGPIGANGAAGPTGVAGTNGANGATGLTGPAGATGTNGANGAAGPTGAAGTNGANGATGLTGAAGATGPIGANGAAGPTGVAGTNGATGLTGPAGATGPSGALNAWALGGNAGTTAGTNFLGTTDNVAIVFKINNTQSGLLSQNNVSFGLGAFNPLSTGVVNTAIGINALGVNTTGNFNTANGANSLYSNTTGSNNVASGYQSLISNTTGDGNVGNGPATLQNNISGNKNTAIGYAAMNANTTGDFNIAIGLGSLQNNISGTSNVALGSGAGYNNTIGNYNTYLGRNADATNNNFMNATAIGYNAKVGASNSMVLGGTGVDAVKVGIGKTIPAQEIDVEGNIQFSKALMPAGNAGTTGQVLTSAGGGVAPTWAAPSGSIAGSGTLNYIPKWTPNGSTLGNSLMFDNGTSVGVNKIPDVFFPSALHVDAIKLGTHLTGINQHLTIVQGPSAFVSANLQMPFTLIGGNSFLDRSEVMIGGSFNKSNESSVQNIIFFTHATKNTALGIERARIDKDGNLGIGTTTPNTTLDVNGSVSYKESPSLALANGANNNVVIGAYSYARITGPTGAFTISGLAAGTDGRLLTLHNTTTQIMTIENTATSIAANQINTLTGANIVTPAGPNVVQLQYNATLAKWIIIGGQNMTITSGGGGGSSH